MRLAKSKNKYNARKIENQHGKFDSVKEYRRYLQLKGMEDRGEIVDLERQVKFKLIPAQKCPADVYRSKSETLRAVTYIADFVYFYRGTLIVEDVKGYKKGGAYNVFKIKKKLMKQIYDIRVYEV